MGNVEFRLKIVNNTNTDIVCTSVWGIDNLDFDWLHRPDRNFQNVFIGAKQSVERREEVSKHAENTSFTMELQFRDGTIDTFRLDLKNSHRDCPKFEHMKKSHAIFFEKICNKVVIRVENTKQQMQNEEAENSNKRAEELNKAGLVAMMQMSFEDAMDKFNKALKMANDKSTADSIKANKSETYFEMGKKRWEDGWYLEADDRFGEAERKFFQAKKLCQMAASVKNNEKIQKLLKLIEAKIDANQDFNRANEMEMEALKLFHSAYGDYPRARDKYKNVLIKYEKAKKKFEDEFDRCSDKFKDFVHTIEKRIDGVKKAIYDIENEIQKQKNNDVNIGVERNRSSNNKDYGKTKGHDKAKVYKDPNFNC